MQILISDKQVLIDDEDLERVSAYRWNVNGSGYFFCSKDSNKSLHRFLINASKLSWVDHINGDKLDNRKSNLRECSITQSQFNKQKIKNTTSKFKGVTWNRGGYISQIGYNYQMIPLLFSKNEEECAFAYNVAAKILGKNFSVLNTVDFHSLEIEERVTLKVNEFVKNDKKFFLKIRGRVKEIKSSVQ